MRLLILGGTGEASALAQQAACLPNLTIISSLAGRTQAAAPFQADAPQTQIRVGGFGGVSGLVAYLQAESIDLLIDATHPFAAQITCHAVEAAALTATPFLRLNRPAWQPVPGDDWREVPNNAAAAALLTELTFGSGYHPPRVFLTIGRQELAAFAHLSNVWFLMRMIEPPAPPIPTGKVLLERGPFDLATERQLLVDYQIQLIVSKNSGGEATYAKLIAARERGIPVVMVQRPPAPPALAMGSQGGSDGGNCVEVVSVAAAIDWLRQRRETHRSACR